VGQQAVRDGDEVGQLEQDVQHGGGADGDEDGTGDVAARVAGLAGESTGWLEAVEGVDQPAGGDGRQHCAPAVGREAAGAGEVAAVEAGGEQGDHGDGGNDEFKLGDGQVDTGEEPDAVPVEEYQHGLEGGGDADPRRRQRAAVIQPGPVVG
jgi:hypothetical protein